jgi:Uma2 family endonuclease
MTFAEFEQLPERSEAGCRYELRHGELFGALPPLQGHASLLECSDRFAGYWSEQRGFSRALPEGEFRIAGVAFISAERWNSADPEGYLMGAPDLVVEVLSPPNTAAEMIDKEQLCLANGSKDFGL